MELIVVNNLNQIRSNLAGSGVSNTSALAFGGEINTPELANTETWDGTSWTEVNDLNTARHALAGCGTQTAALCIGGSNSPALTESWNGTSWTEVADLNTGRSYLGASIQGTPSTTIVFGGSPTTAKTEEWNGSSWAEVNDLNTARYIVAGSGTATAALAFGGDTAGPTITAATEEWLGPGAPVVQTFTDS